VRHAERAEPVSSFEFIAALDVKIIGLGVTKSARWSRSRILSAQRKTRSMRSTLSLTVATLLLLVLQWWVHIQMEHRTELDF